MSNLKEWVEDRQENGDDGTGYEGESDDVETVSWSSSNPTGERGRANE